MGPINAGFFNRVLHSNLDLARGMIEPPVGKCGVSHLARFSGISTSFRRLFLLFSGGKSINRRSSLISDQSSLSTSARRRPVKALIVKKGMNFVSTTFRNAESCSGVSISILGAFETLNFWTPASGFSLIRFHVFAVAKAAVQIDQLVVACTRGQLTHPGQPILDLPAGQSGRVDLT